VYRGESLGDGLAANLKNPLCCQCHRPIHDLADPCDLRLVDSESAPNGAADEIHSPDGSARSVRAIFDVDRLIAAFVILHYDMRNRIRLQIRCI